jgi:hypothetical protein
VICVVSFGKETWKLQEVREVLSNCGDKETKLYVNRTWTPNQKDCRHTLSFEMRFFRTTERKALKDKEGMWTEEKLRE